MQMEIRMKMEDCRPHFYKIIRGEEIKKHLCLQRIPPDFLKNLAGDISGTATLTVSSFSGGHWHVRVWKNPNGTYLEDGWRRFIRENNLGGDEFLLLRYDGNMLFHVKIFEKNGVKRSSSSSSAPIYEQIEIRGSLSCGKQSRGRPRKLPIRPLLGRGQSSRMSTQKTESFSSKFPFFESQMTRSCVEKSFLLSIPHSFANSHFPPTKTKVILRNSAGKAWEVICIYRKSRHSFSGGWSGFVRDNSLKLGDTCIFELVGTNVLQVHVF